MKSQDRLKIAIFLSLSVMFSLIGYHLPAWLGMSPEHMLKPVLQLLLYSWGPGLATIFLVNLMYGGSLAAYGYSRSQMTFKWLFSAMLLPIGFVLALMGLVFVLGNLLHLPGFGFVVLTDSLSSFTHLPMFSGLSLFGDIGAMLPQELWMMVGLVLVIGTIWGATVSLVFNLGEELGFRGFLVRELRELGFIGSNFVIGGLQGVWLLPLLLLSVPDLGGIDMWYIPALIGYQIALAFPAAYLSLKGKSIYISAIFIGVLNIVGQLSVYFIWGENNLISSARGLAGMMILLGATYVILRYDKAFVDQYPTLGYIEEDEPLPEAEDEETEE